MTRKQAVLQAIEILEKNQKNKQIIEVLTDISSEIPLTHWTQKSILDAFTQFIIDNKKLPAKNDLCGRLPSVKTIDRIFGTKGLMEFERKFFPEYFLKGDKYSEYGWYTEEDFKKCFVRNYNKINNGRYVKYDDYNLHREPGTPAISTIIRKLECSSYNDLILKTNTKKVNQIFTVSSNKRTLVHIDID